MISKKARNFDALTKAAKAAGMIGLGEVADIGTSVALGTAKTLQESSWEKKVIIGGVLANIAAGALDLDLPFVNLGIESIAGIDAVVDNASDIAIGVAGASLMYKTANNIQKMHNSKKSVEQKLAELGISLEEEQEEEEEETIFNEKYINKLKAQNNIEVKEDEEKKPQQPVQLTEDQEKVLLQQLLAKYGASSIK